MTYNYNAFVETFGVQNFISVLESGEDSQIALEPIDSGIWQDFTVAIGNSEEFTAHWYADWDIDKCAISVYCTGGDLGEYDTEDELREDAYEAYSPDTIVDEFWANMNAQFRCQW